MAENSYSENSSPIVNPTNTFWNAKFDLELYHHHRIFSLLDDHTLISSQLQVFTSLMLCIVGSISALFHMGILIRRTTTFTHHIFIQSLFDSCHLINILLTHIIVIIVYIKTSKNFDFYFPLSTFFFSLASFVSISFLGLGAFNRYMYLCQKQAQYRSIRHRFVAHQFILITSITWLIFNFPKFDFSENL